MKETYVTRSCISFLLLHQGPPLCLLLSSAPSFMVLLFLHLLIPLTPSVLLECSTKPQNHNPEYGKQVSSSLVVLIWFPGDLSMQEGAYTKLCFQHLSSWLHLSVAHNGILGDFQYKEKGFVPKEKKKAKKKLHICHIIQSIYQWVLRMQQYFYCSSCQIHWIQRNLSQAHKKEQLYGSILF